VAAMQGKRRLALGLQEWFIKRKRELLVRPIDRYSYVAPLGWLPYREEEKKRVGGGLRLG
jgi:hypothetical protein